MHNQIVFKTILLLTIITNKDWRISTMDFPDIVGKESISEGPYPEDAMYDYPACLTT